MRIYLTLLCLLSITACQADSAVNADSNSVATAETQSQPPKPKKGVHPMPIAKPFHGTIRYMQLEGGFFGIVTDRGLKILPMNLDKKYLQDGAEVEFTGVFVKGVVTTQQWGRPFKIKRIEITKPGKPVQNSIY